jgi:hypothetical protein
MVMQISARGHYTAAMRTTLDFDDDLLRAAKAFAGSTGRTLTSVLEEGLRRLLEDRGAGRSAWAMPEPLGPRSRRRGLRPGVDLNDNRAVRDALDA